MAFTYDLSKVINITERTNAAGQRIIILAFRYVTFELLLDDKAREDELRAILGASGRKERKDVPTKVPKFFNEGYR